MPNWRLCESLKTLRKQLNAAFPNRDKKSDGSVADLRHLKAGKSDHIPDKNGIVKAMDVTNDPKTLIGQVLADALYQSKDKRIKYIIFDSRITIQPIGSGWKKYTGKNAHKSHLHISVASDPKLYDDASEWNLKFLDKFIEKNEETPTEPEKPRDLKKGDKGDDVRAMQEKLVSLMYMREADGEFGTFTEAAVLAFQRDNGLREDSIFGTASRAELNKH